MTTRRPSTIRLGDHEVRRLGFGAMRLPGPEVWGEPPDPARARTVLRRAIELGVNLIDSAWYYGPDVAHRLIAEALHPYPKDLVIATKLGAERKPDRSWTPFLRPKQLREGLERDLRLLRLDRIEVVHLRLVPGSGVPFAESLGAMIDLQREGKLRHVALSNVTRAELETALAATPIVAVQNLYHLAHADRDDDVLVACAERGIAFLPFFPLGVGALGEPHPAIAEAARRHGATPAQIALAWLLARSPVMLPIPGTSSPEHLEENWRAQDVALSADEVETIARAAADHPIAPPWARS